MPILKRPAAVIALNVLGLLVVVGGVAFAIHRSAAPAQAPIQVVRAALPPIPGSGSDPKAMGMVSLPIQYAIRASSEYRNREYEACMRDSDTALNFIRNQKQTKDTHTMMAQIALTAARAAKANGSPDAVTRYVGEVKKGVHAVEIDPMARPVEKKGVKPILDAALELESSK